MTRRTRIGLELFGPGLIAGLLINLIWGTLVGGKLLMEGEAWAFEPRLFAVAGFVMLATYGFSGLQSIAYMAVLEWRFARGLDPASWRAVRLSTGLGFLAAMVPFGLFLIDRWDREWINTGAVLGSLGLAVGFLVGLLIKRWSAENETSAGDGT